jgi:methyl coenzyme M reductase gamma subunit
MKKQERTDLLRLAWLIEQGEYTREQIGAKLRLKVEFSKPMKEQDSKKIDELFAKSQKGELEDEKV